VGSLYAGGVKLRNHKIILYLLIGVACFWVFFANNLNCVNQNLPKEQAVVSFDPASLDYRCDNLFNVFVQNLVDVNRAVFKSVDTLKILTWVLPVYLFARWSDDVVHASFYDAALHQNIFQMPKAFQQFTNTGVTALTVVLSLLPLLPQIDLDLRRTSSLFGEGVVSLAVLRTFFKNSLKARSSCRPWNQHFSNKQRALGGFPSGHMAFAGYMTMLFGLRHGPKWGVPLSIFSAFAFFSSINCNRHYVSQLVGGLGLGIIYGYGSYQVLNSRYGEHTNFSFDLDSKNRPSFGVSYEF